MNKKILRRPSVRALMVLAMLWMAGQGFAQEQFFTQSGGRGLQNAKTNARLSKVEGDVDVLNVEMAKVKPHAKAELGSCPDAGDKLRYTGSNWICERETDPTVQGFAKKSLPACTGNSIIGVVGGEFGCVQSGYLSSETDPTVQGFAKTPLPGCGADQVLTVQNGNLSCMADQKGLTSEIDPQVHSFARKDTHPSLPNCGANEMLTMTGGNLSCKVDSVGITQEIDPFTADFARKDIAGYTLAACATGEILRSVTDAGKVVLKCESGSTAMGEALYLNDLKDVDTAAQVSGSVLMFNGTEWRAMSEADPTVPGWAKSSLSACTAGQVLTYDGTTLACVNDAGGSANPLTFAGLDDVNVSGVADGKFVKYDLSSQKWVPGNVADFAQNTLPTCGSGQVLTGDGTTLTCTNDAGGASDPVDLVELGDVRTGANTVLTPADNDFLRYDSGTSKWVAVHDKLSSTLTADKWCYYDGTNVKCDRGAPRQCGTGDVMSWSTANGAFDCVSGTTALGLGSMAYQNSSAVSITGGTLNGVTIGGTTPGDGTFSNLRVTGNLYVSGTQSIDGVSFLNGGVNATGTVTATQFVGNGAGLTGIPSTAFQAAGITGSVQFKDAGGGVSGTANIVWNEAERNLKAAGTVQVAGSGAEVCDAASAGKMRMVDVGGGDMRMQYCRP